MSKNLASELIPKSCALIASYAGHYSNRGGKDSFCINVVLHFLMVMGRFRVL